MPLIPIESIDDPRIEIYRNLRWTNRTRDLGMMVAESLRVARRLVESDCETVTLLISDRKVDKFSEWLPPEVPVYVIEHDQATQLVGFDFHSGVLACGLRPPSPSLTELVDPDVAVQTLVACPQISDAENLGVIIRLANAFGVNGLLIGRGTADPFSRRTLRVSTGSALELPIRQSQDLESDLSILQTEYEFEIAAAVVNERSIPISAVQRPRRLILVLGNETHGIGESLEAICNHRWTIPMTDRVESINVAAAAGILFHKLHEQSTSLEQQQNNVLDNSPSA